MQKLLTKELQKKLPPLYSQDGKKAETVVYGHWFSCLNGWDFYATEYDEESGDMFGFVFGAVLLQLGRARGDQQEVRHELLRARDLLHAEEGNRDPADSRGIRLPMGEVTDNYREGRGPSY